MASFVHVVNGSYATQRVRAALRRLTGLAGRVLTHHDDLSVGSLVELADGPFGRLPVWRSIARAGTHPWLDEAYSRARMRDDAAVLEGVRRAPRVVVWTSNAPSDRLMMLRIVAALEGVENRVFELDVSPFVAYAHAGLRPVALGQRGEVLAATSALRLLVPHERAARTAEFARWSKSESLVRGVRDGEFVELGAAEIDARILGAIPAGRMQLSHAVGYAMMEVHEFLPSDVLVASRIQVLIERGALQLEGRFGWKTAFVTKVGCDGEMSEWAGDEDACELS